MPAINLGRLEREVRRLESLFRSPGELTRSTLEVLGFYAERARRPSAAVTAERESRSLNVPMPVVRAIGMGLHRQVAEHAQDAWPAADALWGAGTRETRLLACWILSGFGGDSVADWIEPRAADLVDAPLMTAVVDRAFVSWRQVSGASYVHRIERWLRSSRSHLQALGLRTLGAGLDMPELNDLHRAFEALGLLPRPLRGEARSALADLLDALARRSPAETTRFLLDAIESDQPGIDRLARPLLASLPPAQRERLAAALAPRINRPPR